MAAFWELDEVIETVVATLAYIEELSKSKKMI